MKFDRISLHTYSLPYRQRVTWSDTVEAEANYVLLRIADDEGRVGYAEATAKPTWSGYTTRALVATLQEVFLPLLVQAQGDSPEQLARKLQLIPGHHQARGMVESALWMLAHPGAGAGLQVPVSCTLTRQAPGAVAEQACMLRETLGVDCFKLKGGQGVEADVEVVRAVRRALPHAFVYVDANSAYAPAQLTAYSAALADAGAAFLEDPCAFTPSGFGAKAQQSHLPLLVDLAATDAGLAAHYAAQGAFAVSGKPGRYGIPETLRVTNAARETGKGVCIGLFGESDLGSLLNLQVYAALPLDSVIAPAELSFFVGLREYVLRKPPAIVDGALRLLDCALDDEAIDFGRMQAHAISR
ncbi:hypothetical protein GCM10023165_48600 [Variovorax defluvii]|uniref:Mandelate racemase/muconate lactonizing enzyme C-terminal domain-containing protein n=1 Tax=Variovorax defluvii TaxID=913761 RepID=A0ABP8ICW4_9BURK